MLLFPGPRLITREFAGLALPTARSYPADASAAGGLAHLVQTTELTLYREVALQARDRIAEYELSLSGPWAPYSFV